MRVLRLSPDDVRLRRIASSSLDRRLAPLDLAAAAYAGLQDSAPRAALISLHARVRDVGPSSWEDPSLVQIWFRGGADYVVPRADVAVFTIGASSRDPERNSALHRVADDVHRVLDGEMRIARDVYAALPQYERGFAIRAATTTGRIHLRWDASKIWIIPADEPDVDAEDAHVELARRFVRWFAPVTMKRFAWWTGLEPRDVRRQWDALSPELTAVEAFGEERFVLTEALDVRAEARGVRFVPHGDPLIKIDPEIVDEARRDEIFPRAGVKTEFWPVAGGLLVDGRFAGSWARQQRRVTVNAWRKLTASEREAVEREALAIPIPGRSAPSVRFHLESAP
jgi:hypothetical protein